MNIVVVDYKMGNLHSIIRRVRAAGYEAIVASTPNQILTADKIILPGVGHFGQAMRNLEELNLINALNEVVLFKKKPVLGICLGMQLMARSSSEGGNEKGLGWFDANIVKLKMKNPKVFKVPHIGWSPINLTKQSLLMKGIDDGTDFYFVHSYYCQCNDRDDILNTSEYEEIFTSAIEKDNIFGVQYHPEKSHRSGINLLKNFLTI